MTALPKPIAEALIRVRHAEIRCTIPPLGTSAALEAAILADRRALERERDEWRHVAAYHLGDFTLTHGPVECRAEAVRRATETGDPAFEALCARLSEAEAALAVPPCPQPPRPAGKNAG